MTIVHNAIHNVTCAQSNNQRQPQSGCAVANYVVNPTKCNKKYGNCNQKHVKKFSHTTIIANIQNFIVNLHKILYNTHMKIGLFGGTFNPPHKTHITMVRQAVEQLQLDKLIIMPCGDPPHKNTDVDKFARLEMCKIAFHGIGEVSDYEITKQGKSYTVDTLKYLHTVYPDAKFYLIIGEDSFRDFEKWYQPQQILQLCTLAVCQRDGVDSSIMEQKYGDKIRAITIQPTDVSSTDIRLRYNFRLPNDQFVDEKVNKYILDNNVYGKKTQVVDKLRTYVTDAKRFNHTYYVVKRGLQLAPNNLREKAFWACLLHDCAKNLPETVYPNYGFDSADMPHAVIHAFLGAIVAQKDFGITDQEILDAIKYHCTARPNMTDLDMLVYVADKTEETRPFPTDHLLKGSLQDMFVACLLEANDYTRSKSDAKLYYLTQDAINFYTKRN